MWAILKSILSFLQYRFCFMLWLSDPETREIFAPNQGLKGPPTLEGETALTTGRPGESLAFQVVDLVILVL